MTQVDNYSKCHNAPFVKIATLHDRTGPPLPKRNKKEQTTQHLNIRFFAILHWLPVNSNFTKKRLLLRLFLSSRPLQSSDRNLSTAPQSYFKTKGNRSFVVVAPDHFFLLITAEKSFFKISYKLSPFIFDCSASYFYMYTSLMFFSHNRKTLSSVWFKICYSNMIIIRGNLH